MKTSTISTGVVSEVTNMDLWEGKQEPKKREAFGTKWKNEVHQWILDIESDQHHLGLPEICEEPDFLKFMVSLKEKKDQ